MENKDQPVKVTVINRVISVERAGAASGPVNGDREIWARFPSHPAFDTKLVTLHYSYGCQDNAGIAHNADLIAELFGSSPKDTKHV
jgi:hypothetical protein